MKKGNSVLGWMLCAALLATGYLQAQSSGRFSRGTGSDPTYHSFVIPLDAQQGVTNAPLLTTTLSNLFGIYRLYHLDATNTGSPLYVTNRIAITNAVAAFGHRLGGSPLYFDQVHRFGIYAGNPISDLVSRTNALLVTWTHKDSGALAGYYVANMPSPEVANIWTSLLSIGAVSTIPDAYIPGLITTIAYNRELSWGSDHFGSMVITHEANTNAANYDYTIWMRGTTPDKGRHVFSADNQGSWSPLYTVSFVARPSTLATFVSQPQFEGKPLPPAYLGKSLTELLAVKAVVTNAVASAATNWLDLDNSPELRQHPTLDQFVADMGSNALALASYVQNEIELCDAIAYNENPNLLDTAVNLGGVNRGALATFMEGQGSPTEQCALLVYLLRRAGVPATYIYGPYDGMQMLDIQLSKLLRMQIKGAVNQSGQVYTTNSLVSVNYPWVAAYVNGEWRHLFPWMKDTEVVEGLNVFDHLPAGYNNGYLWVKQYLAGDANILGLSSETDVPSVLFTKFVEQSLLTTGPGLSVDDMGYKAFNRRHQYSRWSDLPTPFAVTNGVVNTVRDLTGLTNLYPSATNIFDTISIRVFANTATNKTLFTKDLRMVDLHNRKFLVRHQTNGSNYDLYLTLASFRPSLTNVLAFTNDAGLLNPQQLKMTLSTTDDNLTIEFVRQRHRMLPSQVATNDHWASYLGFNEKLTTTSTDPLRLGDLAAICLNSGKVSHKMVATWAQEYWTMQRQVKANPSLTNTLSKDITQGTLPYLMGMAFYERVGRFADLLEQMFKARAGTIMAVGLSKLSAKRNASGQLTSPLTLEHPNVDMTFDVINGYGNNSLRPDLGASKGEAQDPFVRFFITETSAQEHKVIEDFYGQTGGISTIKLLRQAQQAGGPGMLELNINSYGSYHSLSNYDGNIWQQVVSAFSGNTIGSSFANVFITAKSITNTVAGYTGMGAAIYGPAKLSMLISGNQRPQNGGWGLPLTVPIYNPPSFSSINLSYNASFNSSWSVGYSVPSISSPISLFESISSWDTRSTYSDILAGAINWNNNSTFQSQFNVASANLGLPAFGTGAATTYSDIINFGGNYQPQVGLSFAQLGSAVFDPVNAVTGEFYVNATDLSLPGSMPLFIRRNYSSQNLDLGESHFGYGWRFAYQPYLRLVTNNIIFASEMDGTVVAYRQPTAGTNFWKPSPADNPHLNNQSYAGVGSTANLFNNYLTNALVSGITNYYLHGVDGSLRRFEVMSFPVMDSTGDFDRKRPYLQEWQDASGNSYTFSYQSDNTQPDYGHVRRIQSSNGSFLGFYYDVFGHIIEAYTGDGRRLKYIYDDHGDLVTVTFPDESQIDYVYQHLTSATNGVTNIYSTHLIIREEKPDGRVLENAYDDLRRVVTQAATVGGDLKLITNATFTYSNNFTNLTNSVITGVTHVDDVFAHRTSYYYTNNLIARTVDALEQEELQVWFSNTNDPGYYPRSLKSKTDQRGLKTDYQYDAFGNLKQVVVTGNLTGGASSNETATSTFAHTSRHLISTNTDPAGNKTVYLYTNSAFPYLPTTVHKLAGATPVATNLFFYTNVAQTVTNGAVFTNRAFGLLQRTIRGGSATNDFVYDGRGLLVQQVGHSGTTDPVVTNTFFYNNRGELVEQTDAANRVRWFAYDGLGRKTAEEVYEAGQTMPVGFTYSYYNENGELVWTDGSRYNPEDYVWRDYDGAGRQITEIRWRSRAKADGTGVEAETGDALYATTFQEFDGFGNLKRTISPLGVVTTNTWDALGRRVNTKVIATNGAVLTSEGIAYEPGGEVAFHTNALEGLTETLYTSTGKPRFRRNADGSTNGWRYYSDGRLHQEFQNNGAYWESTYDDANRQVTRKFYTATGTALATNITELDARGNVIRTVDAAGFAFTNMFDGLDRLKVAMGPKIIFTNPPGLPEIGDPPPPIQQTTTNFYDAAGVVLTTVNAVGDKTIATTDALGRPVSVEIRNTNNALVRVTTTAYSADQHSATVTNGSGSDALVATSYTDNQGNEVLSVAYPHANVREFTRRVFDPAGNLRNTWRYAATNSALTLFSQEGYGYDGLNRVLSQTNRDSAVTSFEYDVMSHVTNRVMPGGLRWRAEYNAAGQMLKFWNQGEAGGITRSNHFTYYAANHVFAGLPQTHTDGRGVTRTPVYDDYLRPLTNSYAGALPEHNLKTVWRYDLRGAVTNLTQSFTNSSIGPAVSVRRTYDPYNLLASESLWVDGVQHSSADLKWDSAGRRDRLYVGNFLYQFGWQADGVLGSVSASPDVTSPTVGGIYTYNSAGLLTNRVANSLAVSVTARDGVGRVLARTSKVYGVTKLDETLAWTGDGLLANHTVTRAGEFTDARNYDYAAWTRRLVTERVNLDANKRWTNLFTYDAGAASGPGVLTKVAEPQTGGAAWEATLDGFDRIERETNNVIRRIAFGRMNAFVPWASVNVTLDGKPLPLNLLNTGETNWPTQWRTVMELRPGTHTLQAAALHSSGQFTNTSTSTFTNNAVDTTTLSHFDEGQLKYRVWRNASGQTNRVQTFTWDARSRLIATSELDASNNGYNWSAVYDAFDRRLRTTTVIVTNGTALTAQPKTINQFFDPSVEFLELGVEIGGKKTMKVFGPDLAGRYGGRNGSGGLDGVVNDLGIFQSVVSDARGNVHGRYDSGGTSDLIWNASRPTGYGAVPEYRPPALADNGDLASSSAWLGLWSDISGLYWRGKRYLDPVSGSWLSCDPYGFDAGTSLYAFAHGDPINYDDPDGRLAARSTQTGTQNAVPRYELGIAPETHSEIYKSWSYDDIGVPLNTPTLTGPGGDYTFANVVQVPTGNAFSYVGPEGTGASLPTPWQTTRISGQEIAQQQNLRGAMLMMNALLIADGAGAVLEGAGIRLLSAEALATRTVLPDAYAGIRQASQYLQEIGVSRAQRVQILQSFEAETVNLRAASATEFGLRFFDGVNAQAKGRYLFETFPASRESLALSPQWNQMTSFTQWQIREGAMLIEGRAAAQGVGLPGGQIQKFVPNLDNLLK